MMKLLPVNVMDVTVTRWGAKASCEGVKLITTDTVCAGDKGTQEWVETGAGS